MTGTGAQSPMFHRQDHRRGVLSVAGGDEVEERYPIDTFMINADNVAEYGTDGWQ